MKLTAFVEQYGTQPPRIAPTGTEGRLLNESEGVRRMTKTPAQGPAGAPDDDATRHLWVFRPEDVPYVVESAPDAVPALTAGKAKHTNLTGGGAAACGGELWIDLANSGKLYVNGASGRYGPRTAKQLEDAVAVFRGLGFEVESYGWDDDAGWPYRRYFR
jgi:hypothetical protein